MFVSVAQEKTEKSVQKTYEVALPLVYIVIRLKTTLAKQFQNGFIKIVLSKVCYT